VYAERQTERELLAELREIHRSEHATPRVRERILAQLPRSEPSRAVPPRVSRSAWPWRIALAGVPLLALGFWALHRVQHDSFSKSSAEPSAEPASADTVAAEPRKAARTVPTPAPTRQRCPLDEVPRGALYDPQFLETFGEPPGASNLELGTFAMPVPGCGSLIRRYLSYMPRRVPVPRSAPVLLVLHDSGDSAEAVRAIQTQRTFEALADREGLIVVYANAGPGARTGRFPNSGGWQTDPGANRALDDEAYLAAVIEQLEKRGAITGTNPVFLIGYGGGGTLALETAAEHPNRYVGVAALLPSGVNRARPEEHLEGSQLTRVFFIVTATDRQSDYWPGKPTDVAVLEEWAVAIGLPRFEVQKREQAQRFGRTLEEPAQPESRLLPRGSALFSFGAAEKGAPRLRLLVVPHGNELDVGPGGAPAPIDAAAQVWGFLRDAVH
jgi:pimeloyl-ACP methyl ester carboxylesterase